VLELDLDSGRFGLAELLEVVAVEGAGRDSGERCSHQVQTPAPDKKPRLSSKKKKKTVEQKNVATLQNLSPLVCGATLKTPQYDLISPPRLSNQTQIAVFFFFGFVT
jgi:hypothetical protein